MVSPKGHAGPTYQRILFEGSVLARGVYKMLDAPEAEAYLVPLFLPSLGLLPAHNYGLWH